MIQIKGFYYELNKSQRYDAILLSSDNILTIRILNSSQCPLGDTMDINDIDVSPRIGNTTRTITLADGSSFESEENEAIDKWLKQFKSHNALSWVHYLESRLSYVLLTSILVVIFSWGFIQYGVPLMADSMVKLVPKDVNQSLGKGALTLLDTSYFKESKLVASRQENLLNQFNAYTKDYPSLNIKVVFRYSEKMGANALALPDGHIVFTDDMVTLAQDDNELIAILAHEIGHLEKRHLLRRVIQDSLLASLVVLISGDITYASSIVIALPALLLELSYSRQFEQEADLFALAFLKKQNLSTEHFANIMLRLSENTTAKGDDEKQHESQSEAVIAEYLSTHPVTKERIQPFLIK